MLLIDNMYQNGEIVMLMVDMIPRQIIGIAVLWEDDDVMYALNVEGEVSWHTGEELSRV